MPIGSIWGLVRRLWTEGKRPLFVMNAGMFHKDRSSVGLYVEDGKVLVNADTGDGAGNFYMKPNGVFFIAGDRVGVLETARFLSDKPQGGFRHPIRAHAGHRWRAASEDFAAW